MVLGLPLNGVDIRRRITLDGRHSLGFTACPVTFFPEDGEDAAVAWMPQALAGPLAEMEINHQAAEYGAADMDRRAIYRIAARAVCQAQGRSI